MDSHRASQRHKTALLRKDECRKKQTVIQVEPPNFVEDVVSAFLAADIPLFKLNHPKLRSLFEANGKALPSESTARACVETLALREEARIRELLKEKKIFVVVDDSEVAGNKYMNVLVGDIANPSVSYIAECCAIEGSINRSVVVRVVDNVLRNFGIQRDDFALLLSDAARYMTAAGNTLKELYPSLMHVTCVAHLLHNCAMHIRAHFTSVNSLIATVKAATLKNKDRREDFSRAGLPTPPEPVLTRWATWLSAAFFYSENLPVVRTIVNNWEDEGLLVTRAKEAVNNELLVADLVEIGQYRPLADEIERFEASHFTILEAHRELVELRFGNDPCHIRDYLNRRLADSDLAKIVNFSCPTVSPATYELLLQAQPSSAAVERSFSILKKVLRSDRPFKTMNVKKYLMLCYNK